MTDMKKSTRTWGGATSRINADAVTHFVGDLATPIYYVVGPPVMVGAMREMLQGMSVREDSICTEEFYGY